MEATIWKYEMKPGPGGEFELDLPGIGRVYHAAFQGDTPCLWMLHCPDGQADGRRKRRFVLVATGQVFEAEGTKYIDTLHHRGYVFHLFERSP